MPTKLLLKRAFDALHHLADPVAPWEEVLRSVSALIGTDGAVLIVHRAGRVDLQQVGADPAAVEAYAQHFHTQDVLLAPGMVAPEGSWLDTSMVLSQAQRERSPYYNDFMCRFRMRQLGAVLLSRESATDWASLGVQCENLDAGLRDRVEGTGVSRYLRALNGALRARRRRAEQWVLAAESMFDAMGEATLLVSPSGAVVHAGEATHARLAERGLLRAAALWHPSEHTRTAIRAGLARAAAGGVAVHLPLHDTSGGTVQLGLVRAAASLRLLNEDLVFARVRFPSGSPAQELAQLRQSFPITQAEAHVLTALMRGEVAKDYAAREGLSVHTVRKQIAMLMEKMHCTRQLELVHKALRALGR